MVIEWIIASVMVIFFGGRMVFVFMGLSDTLSEKPIFNGVALGFQEVLRTIKVNQVGDS